MTDAIKAAPTLEMIREHRDEIVATAAMYHAYNVRVFGSVARGEATSESDIDLIVSFHDGATLIDHSGLRLQLIDLLGRKVDVIDDHPGLSPNFRRRVEAEAVPL